MSIIENIANYFQGKDKENLNRVPEGICPNCWGNQEYGNVIRKLYEDKQVDVNNHSAHHAFIREFVMNHISGIVLKKGNNGLECPSCENIYEKSP